MQLIMNYIPTSVSKGVGLKGGSRLFWAAKRCFDIVLAVLMIPLVLLAGLIIAILNLRYNPGPLVFTQNRTGKDNKPFRIYKFRTMTDTPREARFALEETDRIGKMGRILRHSRIDELPQVFNILKGDMSFIGPRPEQVAFAQQYMLMLPDYHQRHVIRPGMSGLAQIELGYTADTGGTEKKLQYDLQYIEKSGFRMEAYVLWRTLVTVTTGFGAA